jgi:hypothetical protein
MFFVSLLAGAMAVSHTVTTVRVDPALIAAFGLPGCAEQSVIAQTLKSASRRIERGYMGRCRSKAGRKLVRVRKLVEGVTTLACHLKPRTGSRPAPQPVTFVRPLQQYAVSIPSKEHKGSYYYAVVWSFRTDLSINGWLNIMTGGPAWRLISRVTSMVWLWR